MCTATFYPTADGKFIFTSSRDEKLTRQPSTRIDRIERNGITVICPVDADAGGTWLAANDKGEIWCLLNGAFEKHTYSPPYKKSRGLLLLDAALSQEADNWKSLENLEGMEPFTLLKIRAGTIYNPQVFRWNGRELVEQPAQLLRPQIWSSATLYTPNIIKQREEKWEAYTRQVNKPNASNILNYHKDKVETCMASLLLKNATHKTVSISQLEISASGINWYYTEFLSGLNEFIEFKFDPKYAY
jgi:hypothetical protein